MTTVSDVSTTEVEDAPRVSFGDFGLHPELVASLEAVGIVHPFPIQEMTLPLALAGHDVIGQAKTGTGKTLGFGLPLLHRVVTPDDAAHKDLATPDAPQALVVVPTRELATQVSDDLAQACAQRDIRVLTIYGGTSYEEQIEALEGGVEVVVGTPGRLIDLHRQKHLDLGHVRCVVLDEADEMLDLGFLPDVERLLTAVPERRQSMLFSATMPGPVVAMARKYMTKPTHIRAEDPTVDSHVADRVKHFVYRAHSLDKGELLARILQARGRESTIMFARTKRTADKVAADLKGRGFAAAPLHGDLGQGAREQALRAFRNGHIDVLVATDVAARGIDIDDVTHVINYQCPEDDKTFVHRVGRTGRAGRSGVAVTLVDWDDTHRWKLVDQALNLGIPEPMETYSTSEHLFTDLDIPTEATGLLPTASRTKGGLGAEQYEELSGGRDRGRGSRGGSGRGGSGRNGSGRGHSGSGRGGSGSGSGRSSGSSTGGRSRSSNSSGSARSNERSTSRGRRRRVIRRDDD